MVHENSLPNGDRNDHCGGMCMEEQVLESKQTQYDKLLETTTIIAPHAVWQNAENHGWHDPNCGLTPEQLRLAADLLLIHTEISEACEGLRRGLVHKVPGVDGTVEEELADAVIRIFHVAEKNGIDICKAIAEKHKWNITRPRRHGGKLF